MNEPVTQGLMPLHYAVWQRYYEAAQLLLTRGGNVNAVDECGYSPLHLSAEHGLVPPNKKNTKHKFPLAHLEFYPKY